ncbi:MAG TPA: heavy metal-binding domain-containing protein [Caulobacteraceae bacterium]|jgi:hypothetical protein
MKLNSSIVAIAALSVIVIATPVASLAASQSAPPDAPIAIYTAAQSTAGLNYKALGPVNEEICRKPWELAPTQADALAALTAKARSMGANGLIAVRFDQRRVEIKSACWQRMAVVGTAVIASSTQAAN